VTAQLDALGLAAIRSAVAKVTDEQGHTRINLAVLSAVAEAAGASYTDPVPGTTPSKWALGDITDRYIGRVKRAFERLATDGVVIKVGAGQPLPDGGTAGHEVHYYSRQAFRDAERKSLENQESAASEKPRWDAIIAVLRAQGIEMPYDGRLDADAWELLLGKAGWI
jgi:hypothetical protein